MRDQVPDVPSVLHSTHHRGLDAGLLHPRALSLVLIIQYTYNISLSYNVGPLQMLVYKCINII